MAYNDAGTPKALKPIAEQVLEWVAYNRKNPVLADIESSFREPSLEDLRRIELCAKVVLEYEMMLELYGK